jgi:hypothetical protein
MCTNLWGDIADGDIKEGIDAQKYSCQKVKQVASVY